MESHVWVFTFLFILVTTIFGQEEKPGGLQDQGPCPIRVEPYPQSKPTMLDLQVYFRRGREDLRPGVDLWGVDNCILLEIHGNIEMRPRPEDTNYTVTVEIPRDAVSVGFCRVVQLHMRELTAQEISLYWRDPIEQGEYLNRNLTIQFDRNFTAGTYGVSRISAVFETKECVIFNTSKDKGLGNSSSSYKKTVIDYVAMTTSWMSPLEFVTPVYYSYMCSKPSTYSLDTVLHPSIELPDNTRIKLPSAVLTIHSIKFDAYRPQSAHQGVFQEPTDCVIICWWGTLVWLLIIVFLCLVFLVFGIRTIKKYRMDNRIRGYQSL